jgi:Anti-sigma-D factor RsdA to sigma factor binding region
MPADLAAVQADDALLDLIGSGHGPSDADDELTRVLVAWRHEVHTQPARELVDTSTAMALIRAAARRPVRQRNPWSGSIAAAAAVLVISFSAVGLVAKSAQPGDHLWGVTQVLYREYAQSVETAAAVRTELNEANTALRQGDPVRARAALRHVQQQLPAVGEEQGRTDLTARHRQLEQRLNAPQEFEAMKPPGAPSWPPPVPQGAGPEATKPQEPTGPFPQGPNTAPGSSNELPGGPSATASDPRFMPDRQYPGYGYPRPSRPPGSSAQDSGSGSDGRSSPGMDGGPGASTTGPNNSGGPNNSDGPHNSGDSPPKGDDAPPSHPSPDSESTGPRAPGSGHMGHPRPPGRGFPGCEHPPPRPSYCG